MTPAVRVRVWDNSGAPLPGVTVTMALVNAPAGAQLTGTTAVSDATGVAKFTALSVDVAGAGLR